MRINRSVDAAGQRGAQAFLDLSDPLGPTPRSRNQAPDFRQAESKMLGERISLRSTVTNAREDQPRVAFYLSEL
jgi:hypothetical protein